MKLVNGEDLYMVSTSLRGLPERQAHLEVLEESASRQLLGSEEIRNDVRSPKFLVW